MPVVLLKSSPDLANNMNKEVFPPVNTWLAWLGCLSGVTWGDSEIDKEMERKRDLIDVNVIGTFSGSFLRAQ